ncbi:DUF4174 domain-containing protein [Pelagicoccus sp. NFK12]|uniref:DUF4174 domain-containing protein n=1 Tax=Pelagicoccus enzymogenes TaxID=2773457 RepID=A0A927IGL5_9BACT|nr:DUF4174 domain-containing protein [Pelagicoccus enzymogenes]MBD5778934.1 DUF4174 domain-containing protein [Pelagicoccus enzymogenes]
MRTSNNCENLVGRRARSRLMRLGVSLFGLLFYWQSSGGDAPIASLESLQWKNRVVAYVVSSESEAAAMRTAVERWSVELADRDMLLVNLGEVEVLTEFSRSIGREERERWRQIWDLDLSSEQFVLVGKDGGAKAFQRGKLDLPALFDRIDAMPMRAAELRARRREARPE